MSAKTPKTARYRLKCGCCYSRGFIAPQRQEMRAPTPAEWDGMMTAAELWDYDGMCCGFCDGTLPDLTEDEWWHWWDELHADLGNPLTVPLLDLACVR